MFFRKFWRKSRDTNVANDVDNGSGNGKRIDYIKLEERRVLNATFAFDLMTGELTLDNFTDDFAGDNQLNISQSNDQYLFTLTDGIWTSIGGVGSIGDGTNVLAIDAVLVSRIEIVSNTADQFGIEFSDFAFAGDLQIFQEAGFEVFSSLSQELGTQFTQIGALNIDGVQSVELQNLTNDFDLVEISNVTDARLTDVTSIIVRGATAETTLSIQADGIFLDGEISANDIRLHSSAGISQTLTGIISAENLLLEGAGSFDLDTTLNEVDNLAANIDGPLSYTGNGDINFASLLVDGVAVDGLSIADDLSIDISADNGSLSQTAALQVSGITHLDVGTGDICLTNGDGNSGNDLNALVIVSATNAEIVDANDLTVLSANVINQLRLAAGDADLDLTDGIGGTLTLAGDVTVGNQVLLQASAGIDQQAGTIDTTQLLLGGDQAKEGNGTFDLQQGNRVEELAASLFGELTFAANADLTLVSALFDSVCDDPIANPDSEIFTGISTSNGPVKLHVGNHLMLDAQLNVGISNIVVIANGNLTQSNLGAISAGGLGLMINGSTVLNGANDVVVFAADNGGSTIFNDVNSLNIGVVSISIGGGPAMEIAGISTVNSDLKVTVNENLFVDDAITLGAGIAFFDVAGNLSQTAAGTITANGLGLMVGGSTLLSANNDVNVIAADNEGLTVYRDVNGLIVGSVTVAAGTAFEMSVVGITASNDDAKLIVGGNLALNQLIDVGNGSSFLTVGGNLSQAAAGTITANGLGLMVGGSTLLGSNNAVNVIAADNEGLTVYRDNDGLTVGSVTVAAGTAFEMTVTGITTSNDDVKLIVGGNLTLNQSIDVGNGSSFLTVGGNLNQAASGTITTNGLGLMVSGSTLLGVNNNVNVIAADNQGLTVYRDVDGLTVGSVTVAAGTAFEMTVTGITTSNDDAKLIVGGNLALNQLIDVGNGNTFLTVGGNLSQAAAGTITANGLGLMVGGSTLLGANNDVNVIAADNQGLTAYRDVDGLTVGSVTVAAGTAFEMTVAGITTSNDDAKLIVGGNLALNQLIDTGGGTTFLTVAGNLSQFAAGTITANGLGLMVGGSTLLGANNDVNVMAADNEGLTAYRDVDGLTVGSVTVAAGTAFEMTVTGITTSNDDAKLIAGGNLALNQLIDTGGGTTFLTVAGNLSQAAAGTITANDLGLMVGGSTLLGANNDVNVIAADNQGLTAYRDVDGLTVGSVTVAAGTAFEMSVAGITTSNDDAKLIVGGNLALNQSIDVGSGTTFLMVAGNLSQAAAGTITAHDLGLMVGGSTLLGANNDVNVMAADNEGLTAYRDVDGLTVGAVTVAAGTAFEMSVTGITTSNDDAKLIVGGNLALNQLIDIGSGNTFLTVGGNLSQAAAGTITANGLGLMVAGSTMLGAINDVETFAAANGGLIIFNDVDDLLIGSVTVAPGSAFEMTIAGITTSNDDTKLIAGGDLLIDNRIATGTANVFFDVAGDVSQTQTGTINAGGLALMIDGSTSLLNAANSIDRFAADNVGSTSLRNSSDLTISRITVDGMEIVGATLRSQFFADVNGSIRQTEAIFVNGTTNLLASGDICLSGADSNGDGANDNDFVGMVTAAASGSSLELSDANQLTTGSLTATDLIRLRSGDGANGALALTNSIVTTASGGRVLLQSDRGVTQSVGGSVIATDNLLLGSSSISDARRGEFVLLGNNVVKNIAGELDNALEFTNRRDLNISPLSYHSACTDYFESFRGLSVGSIVLNVTAGGTTLGHLSDSSDAETVIDTTARLNVAADIMLGDGNASLQFKDHSIDKLLSQNVSDAFVQISAAGNRGNADGSDIVATANVSLFVDSTIILSDVNVQGTLFIDTIEGTPDNGSAGDILQTMISDSSASTIVSESAAFVSKASVQLTNTLFDQLAIEANQNVSQLIRPFILNANIGSTFTGSIDANVFADPGADPFLNGGDPANPVDGVFDVEDGFRNDGFFAGNNQFLNPFRVGAVVVNGQALTVVAFDTLGLSAVQMADVENGSASVTSRGDIYLETLGASNLDISANLDVTSGLSNITVVAGDELALNGGAELRRSDNSGLLGLVNTLQFEFPFDQFLLTDPRSVLDAPGNIAFSDLNAQLDTAIGFQNFEFFFGNAGQTSFNLIIGWFVDGVSSSDALNALFQQTLLQGMSDLTGDFLLSNFGNFGQSVSAYSLRLDSQLAGIDSALSLTNTSRFEQFFFANRPFLLSQVFLTNDARINLFADGGSTDLNFTQEVIPTRTVVQNPDFIVVATPTFDIPEPPANAPQTPFNFVNLIQDPESEPLSTEQQPESYFLIKYTADDDGAFEESFRWDDPNDDPDAIRAAIEDAQLNDDDKYWPETDGENEGGWFEKITEEKQVKPGLYFIFEFQDGEIIPEPVDAPVDRTDLENLIQQSGFENALQPLSEPLQIPAFGNSWFSDATRNASIGSSLLLAQCLLDRSRSNVNLSNRLSRHVAGTKKMFSRAARFLRKQHNRFSEGLD